MSFVELIYIYSASFPFSVDSVSSGSVSWESGAYNVSKGEFVLCGCTSGQCSHSKDMKYSCSVKWPHHGLVSFHFMRKPHAACGVGNRNHKLSSPPSSPGKTENCQIGTNFKMGREFGHWYLRSGNSGSKNFISFTSRSNHCTAALHTMGGLRMISNMETFGFCYILPMKFHHIFMDKTILPLNQGLRSQFKLRWRSYMQRANVNRPFGIRISDNRKAIVQNFCAHLLFRN